MPSAKQLSFPATSVCEDSDEDKSIKQPEGCERVLQIVCSTLLFVLLLTANVGQRAAFKSLGYVLGSYPYFILVVISAAFVVVFGIICLVIIILTGGFLPETRTWRCVGIFAVIGGCNALQGIGMVFANPYVPGNLQALLQQAVIPFTLAASVICLRSKFSLQQYAGVALICLGIAVQLLPKGDHAVVAKGHETLISNLTAVDGNLTLISAAPVVEVVSTVPGALLFVFSQLPVALGAIFQEQAFAATPVNVFHMIFLASTFQLVVLIFLAPLDAIPIIGDATSLKGFMNNFVVAWSLCDTQTSLILFATIVTMLLSQLAQAMMVKHTSAAFTVLCMAFVVPCAALAFTQSWVAGPHTEPLTFITFIAMGFVFIGIICYRLGSQPSSSSEPPSPTTPLMRRARTAPPQMCTAGVGIIASEYSNRRHSKIRIWEERTLRDPY